ncbi:hypothetical protein [Burkholderia metallica]|uniref:hypothetical protein n=1 Tax=Burkholderia metallica TaxID=488729 RepID=UPI001CF1C956|nr:hypothetical protein [Burkholderia metallica]MCA8022642.1 hypothetical protein [Burkholderia metallica]
MSNTIAQINSHGRNFEPTSSETSQENPSENGVRQSSTPSQFLEGLGNVAKKFKKNERIIRVAEEFKKYERGIQVTQSLLQGGQKVFATFSSFEVPYFKSAPAISHVGAALSGLQCATEIASIVSQNIIDSRPQLEEPPSSTVSQVNNLPNSPEREPSKSMATKVANGAGRVRDIFCQGANPIFTEVALHSHAENSRNALKRVAQQGAATTIGALNVVQGVSAVFGENKDAKIVNEIPSRVGRGFKFARAGIGAMSSWTGTAYMVTGSQKFQGLQNIFGTLQSGASAMELIFDPKRTKNEDEESQIGMEQRRSQSEAQRQSSLSGTAESDGVLNVETPVEGDEDDYDAVESQSSLVSHLSSS